MTAATPGPDPDLFSFLSIDQDSTFRNRRETFAFSLLGQAAILALIDGQTAAPLTGSRRTVFPARWPESSKSEPTWRSGRRPRPISSTLGVPEPVAQPRSLGKTYPIGAAAFAVTSASGCRHTKVPKAATDITPQPSMPSQADGTCRNMILTVAPC